ncbi:type IV pilin protein [Thiovibrio sp. JS02]
MKKSGACGFTLVELMIVVAIIGILAAVALLQFNRFRVKAYNSAALTDVKNVKTELEAYHVEHQNYPTE